jgi:hypothetical protein
LAQGGYSWPGPAPTESFCIHVRFAFTLQGGVPAGALLVGVGVMQRHAETILRQRLHNAQFVQFRPALWDVSCKNARARRETCTEVELRVIPMSGSSPGKIDEYFNLIQRELAPRLELSRLQNTDTAAKGVAAERFLGDILRRVQEPSRPTYRRQIIDSTGASSGEVDLIFCNWAQPSVHTELFSIHTMTARLR